MGDLTDAEILTDAEFEAAEARGRKLLETEPRASAARYDRNTGRVTVDLMNGCTYIFPAHLIQDLNGADDDDLEIIEIDGMGFSLHWPRLDADLYVPRLLAGIFGTKAYMARLAGQATSPAKAAAPRANGLKSGHPRKTVAK